MTGRIPARTGLNEVLWPGSKQGLHPEEVTIATLLSEAGYKTAFHGKWHMGDAEEFRPPSHGFDEGYYTLYNAAPWAFGDKRMDVFAWPESVEFAEKYPIEGIIEFKPGEKPREVEELSAERIRTYDEDLTTKTVEFIKRHADDDEPFFVYHAASKIDYWGAHPDWQDKSPGGSVFADQMMEHDHNVGQILQTVRDLGIEENTLVVWMSDNGPMYGVGARATTYHWLRGGKGDVLEGGVRVPAIAWWPGMIEPGQDPMDIFSITDWFTTAARLGEAKDNIPDDRVTDGVDQACLLLHGEGYSHRDYIFLYGGPELGAVRKRQYKTHAGEMHGGLPTNEVYDVVTDPGEKFVDNVRHFGLSVPFQDLVREHMTLIEKFPHRVLEDTPGAGHIRGD